MRRVSARSPVFRFVCDTVTDDDRGSAPSACLVNAKLAYVWEDWTVTMDVRNLFNNDDYDIDYQYASRLPDNPEPGVKDLHYHPVEPHTARLAVSFAY